MDSEDDVDLCCLRGYASLVSLGAVVCSRRGSRWGKTRATLCCAFRSPEGGSLSILVILHHDAVFRPLYHDAAGCQ